MTFAIPLGSKTALTCAIPSGLNFIKFAKNNNILAFWQTWPGQDFGPLRYR